jgi:hypothetical protein
MGRTEVRGKRNKVERRVEKKGVFKYEAQLSQRSKWQKQKLL